MLYEAGKHGLAMAIDDVVSSHRGGLELLEESYAESRYGEFEYLESQGCFVADV